MQGDTSLNIDDLDVLLAENSFNSEMNVAKSPKREPPKSKTAEKPLAKSTTPSTKRRRPQFQRKIDLDTILNDLPVPEEGLYTPKLSLNNNSPDSSPKMVSTSFTPAFMQTSQHIEDYLTSSLNSLRTEILDEINQMVDKSTDYSKLVEPFLADLRDQIKNEVIFSQNTYKDIDIDSEVIQFRNAISSTHQIQFPKYETQTVLRCHTLAQSSNKIFDDLDQKQKQIAAAVSESISFHPPKYYPSFSNLESMKSKRLDCEVKMATLDLDLAFVKKNQEKLQSMRSKYDLMMNDSESSMIDSDTTSSIWAELRGLNQDLIAESSKLSTFFSATRREYDSEFRHTMSASSDWNDAFLIYYTQSSAPNSPAKMQHIPRVSLVEEEDEMEQNIYNNMNNLVTDSEDDELSQQSSSILDYTKIEQNLFAERRKKRDNELMQASAFLKDKMKAEVHNMRSTYRKPK